MGHWPRPMRNVLWLLAGGIAAGTLVGASVVIGLFTVVYMLGT